MQIHMRGKLIIFCLKIYFFELIYNINNLIVKFSGPTHPTISIHNLAGQTLNIIRHYEGFMSHRISSISCLSYHPHRMALAAGTSDSTVTVYCIDQIRR